MKHSLEELQQWQALPLSVKVLMSKERIRAWVNEYGLDNVYVLFSGGIDSTVLLHLCRSIYPDMLGAYCDTGLEYPQIRDFVKTFDNIVWLKPEMTFREVIEKYGYPLPSKEVAMHVQNAKSAMRKGKDLEKHRGYLKLNGRYLAPSGEKSHYNCESWGFLLNEDCKFNVSPNCCTIMKKNPSKLFEKQTGRKPISGTMASESKQRTTTWLKQGCNAFDVERPISTPLAFWTKQDVLLYIKQNNLPICEVYGEIVEDDSIQPQLEGQMSLTDFSCECGLFDIGNPLLKNTGVERTGCMYCLFGAHLSENPPRFVAMRETNPKTYDYIMRPWEEEVEITDANGNKTTVIQKGLNYKEVIDYVNAHSRRKIQY